MPSPETINNDVLNSIYKQISFLSGWLFIGISITKYFLHYNLLTVLSFFIIGLSYLLLCFFFNKHNKTNYKKGIIFFLTLYISIVFMGFILNGGIYSPAVFFLFPIIIITLFLFERKNKILITLFIFISYLLLAFTEYFWPQLFKSISPTNSMINFERTIAMVTSMFITTIIIRKVLEQYSSSKEKALESERIKSEFLETMSHMIRTPLNSINGFGELLLEDDISDEERKVFKATMVKNAITLNHLISDLSDLAIIQDKALTLHPANFPINLLLNEIGDKAQKELEINTHQISFNIEVEQKVKETVLYTDYQRLLKVIWHILQNGFKFTKKGSVIFRIEISKHSEQVHISILDTGVGMTEKEQEQLFSLIYKQNAGYNTREEGTGLGLNIAKGILEYMGGKIEVISEISIGTRVNIIIPKKIAI